jgi:dCTP diphosphatase
MTGANDLEVLKEKLRSFALERDWDRFHSPKNLSMALVAEVASSSSIFSG